MGIFIQIKYIMVNFTIGGILDIMRGISTVASSWIIGSAVVRGMEDIFRLECDRCNGVGKVTCTKCNGTKTLARRPAQKVPNMQIFNRRDEDLQECYLCGRTTDCDNNLSGNSNYDIEYEFITSRKCDAKCNTPTVRKSYLAGTIICPICRGQCFIWHFVPNIRRAFGLEEIWYNKPCRKGFQAFSPTGWPQPHSKYMEWPCTPLRPITEREVGYFGEDVFDFEDQMFEKTRNRMEISNNEETQ